MLWCICFSLFILSVPFLSFLLGYRGSLALISLLALLPPAVWPALLCVDQCWLTEGQRLFWVLGYSYREGQASLGILVCKPYPESGTGHPAETFLKKLSPAILGFSQRPSSPASFRLVPTLLLTLALLVSQVSLLWSPSLHDCWCWLSLGTLTWLMPWHLLKTWLLVPFLSPYHRVKAAASLHLPCSPLIGCFPLQ